MAIIERIVLRFGTEMIIRLVIKLCQEIARRTDNDIDDEAVAIIEALFEEYTGDGSES